MFKRKRKHNKLLDRELINFYKLENDMAALGELFGRYAHLVASIALGILKNEKKAEDVVQQIFEIVVKDLKLHDVKNFNAWIYSVTKFHCFKIKKIPQASSIETEIESKDDFDDVLEKELLLQKRIDILKNSLNKIKPQQKECIELFYLKGYSYKEINIETGFTIKEVKSFIQNGKRNLKLLIQEK